jgi:hypothetical protein
MTSNAATPLPHGGPGRRVRAEGEPSIVAPRKRLDRHQSRRGNYRRQAAGRARGANDPNRRKCGAWCSGAPKPPQWMVTNMPASSAQSRSQRVFDRARVRAPNSAGRSSDREGAADPTSEQYQQRGRGRQPQCRSAAIAGDGRLDALADPRLASKRLADPGRSLTRLLMTKISRAELTMSRSLRALAIAHQQPRVSAAADDCFARPDVAVLTIVLATFRSRETNLRP